MRGRLCLTAAFVLSGVLAGPAVARGAPVDWYGRVLEPGVTKSGLDVGGLHTRMLQAGPPDAREAIVFVHGNPGSSLDWVHLVSVAGQTGRAVAIDMPGFGQSDKRDNFPYSVDGEADFLQRALTKLGIDRVHLVLHDFGGPFGLQWATRHPDALKSVVLLDTGVFLNYYGHPLAFVWHTPVIGEAQANTTTRETFTAEVQSGNPRLLPADFVNRMYDEYDAATRRAALKLYRSISNPDAMGRAQAAILRRRQRPALVIWGASDQYIPAYVAYEQDQAFPGAQVHLLDSGHWPFVDNVDKVDALALPFWRRVVPRFSPALRKLRFSLQRVHAARAQRYSSLRLRVCSVDGKPVTGVRARLYRRRAGRVRLAGSSGRSRNVTRCGRLSVRLKQRLRHGARYRLVVSGDGVVPAKRVLRVR
jgi:pimeloyl-ACP methyl ester carboxylesterase